MLIVYFFDVLQRAHQQGQDGMTFSHHENPENPALATTTICSHTFVDDTKDVATSYAGIQHRTSISNQFTGIHGTGSVYGNSKSFFMYYDPTGAHHRTVELHNGIGEPKPVTVVAPNEGFKDLGIQQGSGQ